MLRNTKANAWVEASLFTPAKDGAARRQVHRRAAPCSPTKLSMGCRKEAEGDDDNNDDDDDDDFGIQQSTRERLPPLTHRKAQTPGSGILRISVGRLLIGG